MKAFILRRIFALVWLVIGVSIISFILLKLSPGDFLTPVAAQRDISAEFIDKLKADYGLDKPWHVQYGKWLWQMLHLDFGYSWTYKVPVSELLLSRVPATLTLAISSLLFSWLIAIPLGVLAAIYKDSFFDRISSALAYAGMSIPEFFLALVAVWFAAKTGWFPIGGITSIQHDFLSPGGQFLDYLSHLILPTIILGIGGIAGMMRIMRANFLDVIRAEYVTTARAKGLSEGVVMFRHVFRNAINPLLSTFGYVISGLLGGALFVENIMNYPGLGQLMYDAIIRKDQFVVLSSLVIGTVLLIVGNLISDILLAWSDPRIRHQK